MSWDQACRLKNLPRERLEEVANRALLELQSMRAEIQPSGIFRAVMTGFLIGALAATGGFLFGAALR